MNTPVDIVAFRHAIGYDADAERMLLRLFLETVDAAMGKLHAHMPPASWEAELHLIKGAAMNLGAAKLTAAAMEAHAIKEAPQEEKQEALTQLSACYTEVREYLLPLSD